MNLIKVVNKKIEENKDQEKLQGSSLEKERGETEIMSDYERRWKREFEKLLPEEKEIL